MPVNGIDGSGLESNTLGQLDERGALSGRQKVIDLEDVIPSELILGWLRHSETVQFLLPHNAALSGEYD